MLILDKHGWPVAKIKGRKFVNILRLIIHGRKIWGTIDDWNIVRNHHMKSDWRARVAPPTTQSK